MTYYLSKNHVRLLYFCDIVLVDLVKYFGIISLIYVPTLVK